MKMNRIGLIFSKDGQDKNLDEEEGEGAKGKEKREPVT
ncbi:hypothetical protein GXM_08336 [Nostoc sphaeroides CCNUC1]|uniref:Uncharacterized protein n=1 Tax=Nostoc sphaeroides CCNUC1 TaxID=2653204 RepID=A0A5P8WE72_9NOSO|nr:hypothetical protein GXM_08336 [Nostoc sphaeroides CCNUC1]